MHNILGSEKYIRHLNWVPLHPYSKWTNYAFRTLPLYSTYNVSASEIFQKTCRQVRRSTRNWSFSHWNHLLVLMFGQLIGCSSLRELTDITVAHGKRSYHLGFGKNPVTKKMLCPKRTPSETIASLKSLPSTWCLWLRSEESPEGLNSMDDSMQLTRLPLTSACPCLSGLTSEAQSLASESTHRLISSRRYLSSTELRPPRYMIPKLWTGLHTSHWLAMF